MQQPSSTIIESTRIPAKPDKQRLFALWMIMWLAVGLLAARSFYLQVVKGDQYRSAAEENRVAEVIIPAPRGLIYDRYGHQLVENIPNTDLIFDPNLLPAEENEAYLIENLNKLLPATSPEQVRQALAKTRESQRPTLIARALDHDTVLTLQQSAEDVAGTRLISSLVRQYPYANQIAHVLGYTGVVTAEELAEDETLFLTDTTGKSGIEKTYDQLLRGQHGSDYTEVNAAGRPHANLGYSEPTPGQDLQLALDLELQTFIYALFSERDQKHFEQSGKHIAGSAVALHPQSGEILALLSYPSFDPNAFSQPARADATAQSINDQNQPLFNRAIAGTYPPGSIVKPLIASGALQEGVIAADTTVLSTGGLTIGPWRFPDWKAGGHGLTDVKKAIAESVNTFFYMATGGLDEKTGLGVEKTTHYLEAFGWSKATGIDLPAESTGFLPSPAWKEAAKGEPWYIGDTYHLAIGQGDVLVTPLQVAAATAGIADGQYLYQPHLVNLETIQAKLPVFPAHTATVRQGMRQTVTEGSARALASLPVAIAGKTGTAQIGGTDDTHAWFTSFAPYDNPELVVTVLLERGGGGDTDAVPFAKEIWQWWADNRTP